MKRTLIAVLSIVFVLFAFSACRPQYVFVPGGISNPSVTVDPTVSTVNDYNDLLVALTDESKKTAELAADLELTPEEAVALNFGRDGFVFDGKGNTITVIAEHLSTASLTARNTVADPDHPYHIFTIDANNVVFRNVNIVIKDESLCTYAVVVNGDNFIFENGSIEGVVNAGNSASTVNMGICIGANAENTTVRNSEFRGCFSPVYSTPTSFTIENVGFEKGMEFEEVGADSIITDCYDINGTYPASLNIHKSGNAEIDVMKRFMANNEVNVTAGGKTYNEILAMKISDFADAVIKSEVEKEMKAAVVAMGKSVLELDSLKDITTDNVIDILTDETMMSEIMNAAKGSSENGLEIAISDYSLPDNIISMLINPVSFTISASAEDYKAIFREGYQASGTINFTFTGKFDQLEDGNYGYCLVCDSYTASSDDLTLTDVDGNTYEVAFSNFEGKATFIVDPKEAYGDTPAHIEFDIKDFEVPTESDATITVNGYSVEYADIYAGTDQGEAAASQN